MKEKKGHVSFTVTLSKPHSSESATKRPHRVLIPLSPSTTEALLAQAALNLDPYEDSEDGEDDCIALILTSMSASDLVDTGSRSDFSSPVLGLISFPHPTVGGMLKIQLSRSLSDRKPSERRGLEAVEC